MSQISATFALTAEKQLLEKKFEEAILTCTEGLEFYPNYPAAMCILAKAYYFSDDFETANSVINTAFEHFPANIAIKKLKNAISDFSLEMDSFAEKNDNNYSEKEVEDFEIIEEIEIVEKIDEENDISENEIESEIIVEVENFADNNEIELENDISDLNIVDEKNEEKLYHINEIEKLTVELKNLDKIENFDLNSEEIDEEIFDENNEFERIGEETFFPDHTLQDSIAEVFDEEDKAENFDLNLEKIEEIEEIISDENETVADENIINSEEDFLIETENNISETVDTFENFETLETVETLVNTDDLTVDENEFIVVENIVEEEKNEKLISDLYSLDLEFPRVVFNPIVEKLSLNHLEVLLDYSEINFFLNENFSDNISEIISKNEINFQKTDEQIENKSFENDLKTQDLLDIAKGLENAKITPVFEEPEEESFETPLVASETMAKILVKQNAFEKAIKIYQLLIVEKPEKADFFKEQIENLSVLLN